VLEHAGTPTTERWERAYLEEAPRVFRALLATLRDRDAARDALHEAFLAGLERPPAHGDNLAGWLFRVALRKSRRGPYRPLLSGISEALWPAAGHDEIAQALDRLEAGRLLGLLTERQRAVVIAQYYLGLEQAEIARLFNVRRGTVAATLAQALARMKRGGQHAV
jgi:DNA-directed RNA polymerase specialized sigma24 family protein